MPPRDSRLDLPTIAAIGAVVYLIKNVLHELVGHGGVCVLVGGDPVAVSSAWWHGTYELVGAWGVRWTKAGGTLVNLIAGLVLVASWRSTAKLRARRPTVGYFLWLTLVTNLLSGGGYMMVDPIGNFGDWGAFVEGLAAAPIIRVLLVVTGAAVSLFALFFGVRTIEPFLGRDHRRRRALALCWTPYLVGGIVFPVSALFNPVEGPYVFTTALATLGGTAWLAWWLPFQVKGRREDGPDALGVSRSWPWIALGIGSVLFTLFVLGPSIVF